MSKKILMFITVLLSAFGISWGITVGLVKLITLCFGLPFSLSIATGVWLVLCLLYWVFGRGE